MGFSPLVSSGAVEEFEFDFISHGWTALDLTFILTR